MRRNRFALDPESGELFYVGSGEDYEGGDGPYTLTVRAGDGTHTVDTTVTVTVSDEPEAPAFGERSYAFELAENADGSTAGVALGTVSAEDPDGDAVRYELVGGNERGLFASTRRAASCSTLVPGGLRGRRRAVHADGSGAAGTHTVDAAVTVTVTDEPEAPAFGETSSAFVLAENTDGSTARVALGTVTAEDPDRDAVRYELVGGNERGLFALDAESGELFYVGSGRITRAATGRTR